MQETNIVEEKQVPSIVLNGEYIVISSGNDKQIGTLLRKRVNEGKASFTQVSDDKDSATWLMVERNMFHPVKTFFSPHKGVWRFNDSEFDIELIVECSFEESRFQGTSDASAEAQWAIKIASKDFNKLQDYLEFIIPKRYPEPEREHEFTTYVSEQTMQGYTFRKVKRTIFPIVKNAVQPELIEIMEDINAFMDKADWYNRRFIPHKRGYLMYGPPGTGKSTAVKMLGSLMEMDVYSISPDHMQSAEGIRHLFGQVPEGSIILVEDIDTLFLLDRNDKNYKNNHNSQNGAALNALLQALDGLTSYNGSVFIATTNHHERIDHAMLRAGRIDVKREVGAMKSPQVEHFFAHFYEVEASDYQYPVDASIKIADLMNAMLSNIEDQQAAMDLIGISEKTKS